MLFLVFMFNPRLPPSLSSVASDCDTDLVQYHTTSELLCVMSVVVDGEVPMEVEYCKGLNVGVHEREYIQVGMYMHEHEYCR